MTDPAPRTSGRRKVGRPPIPLDRIVRSAVAIIDEQGAQALTLRALAARLGSSTSTLYRHVENRAHLVSLVVDHVVGEIEVDPGELQERPWDDACRTLAHALFAVLVQHRDSARLLSVEVPTGPHAMDFRELVVGSVLRGGFDPRTAAHFATAFSRTVLGFAMQADVGEDVTDPAPVPAIESADPERHPSIAAVSAHLPTSLADEFELAIDLLVEGLRSAEMTGGEHHATRSAAGSRSRSRSSR
ncbi:TetR family transcriptional regulator [Nocardioides silvaticus]|uniref:TetR family transcriptional regulator n=1 Tax=Nocardioides silvaticus TaxID=2201891 RepID=A0A316TGL4_9ACTN|nr:TetR/AcrR family transcriptional regulator [Nocardioides silvaticus]PWN02938.1 TetR family transcriptional regulator [Nocardioides silvaticus]